MFVQLIFVFLPYLISLTTGVSACRGCVSLDEHNFEKIISKFEAVLVKFDIAFPYGDIHEIYSKLSEETSQNQDLIFAEVGVKDYGEKDNERLAKKFSVKKEDFPVVKLFKRGFNNPIDFPSTSKFEVDVLRMFIRDNTELYIGLPGCLEDFDKLATQFMNTQDKSTILKNAVKSVENATEQNKKSAKTYTQIMKKIIEIGKIFLTNEAERVGKLLKEKISPKKTQELQTKLNIIRAFTYPRKDEL